MMKIENIKALPGSGWGKMRSIGKNIMINACTWRLKSFKFTWTSLRYFAIAKAVAALANSEGCNVKLPIAYQHRWPAIVFPKRNKPAKDRREIAKIMIAYFSKNLASIAKTLKISGTEKSMNKNCFPYICVTSKIEVSPSIDDNEED